MLSYQFYLKQKTNQKKKTEEHTFEHLWCAVYYATSCGTTKLSWTHLNSRGRCFPRSDFSSQAVSLGFQCSVSSNLVVFLEIINILLKLCWALKNMVLEHRQPEVSWGGPWISGCFHMPLLMVPLTTPNIEEWGVTTVLYKSIIPLYFNFWQPSWAFESVGLLVIWRKRICIFIGLLFTLIVSCYLELLEGILQILTIFAQSFIFPASNIINVGRGVEGLWVTRYPSYWIRIQMKSTRLWVRAWCSSSSPSFKEKSTNL